MPYDSSTSGEYTRIIDRREHYWRPHPDHEDIALIQSLSVHKRKARDDFKVGRSMLPYPVYVARFADGTQSRLSFFSTAGKPIDFAAGFNVSMILGRAVPVSGHVEHGDQIHLDPHFTPQASVTQIAKRESPAKRLAAICRALNEGQIEAAMLMAKAA